MSVYLRSLQPQASLKSFSSREARQVSEAVHITLFEFDIDLDPPVGNLSACEWFRASKFMRKQDRLSYVWARVALRAKIFSNSHQGQIIVGKNGKPYIPGGPHFSISHTDNRVGIAVTELGPIGLDIEPMDRTVDINAHLSQSLSSTEGLLLADLKKEKRANFILRTWVRKEALLKATGLGLVHGLRRLSFHSVTNAKNWRDDSPLALHDQWHVSDIDASSLGLVAALCVPSYAEKAETIIEFCSTPCWN